MVASQEIGRAQAFGELERSLGAVLLNKELLITIAPKNCSLASISTTTTTSSYGFVLSCTTKQRHSSCSLERTVSIFTVPLVINSPPADQPKQRTTSNFPRQLYYNNFERSSLRNRQR